MASPPGQMQEVYDEVLQRRIMRGNDVFILRVLGAFGAFCATLAYFFDPPWTTPNKGLRPEDQARVLNLAAFALTSLGRVADSIEPRLAGLDGLVRLKDWTNAAMIGAGLTDSLLALGRLGEAVTEAETSLAHASRSGDVMLGRQARARLIRTLHMSGDTSRAAVLLKDLQTDLERGLFVAFFEFTLGDSVIYPTRKFCVLFK